MISLINYDSSEVAVRSRFHDVPPSVDSLVDLAVDSAMENRQLQQRPRHCVEELHAQDLGQGKVLRVVRH